MNITEVVEKAFEITCSGRNKTRKMHFKFKLTCENGENFSASFHYQGGYQFGRGDTAEEAVEAAYNNVVADVEAHPWPWEKDDG